MTTKVTAFLSPMLTALLSLLMCELLFAQAENGSMFPQRPQQRVDDEVDWFSQTEKDQLAAEIDMFCEDNEMDVFVVTRSVQPPQGAAAYARALGKAWSQTPVWCVVLHVPGDPSGFHVQGGGANMNSHRVDKALAAASTRARQKSTAKERVMAAWRECSEVLHFIHVSGKRRNAPVVEQQDLMMETEIADGKWKKVLLVSGVGVMLITVLAIFLAMGIIRKNRLPAVFEFPETSWRLRYQAPHSGGGGLVMKYRVPKHTSVDESGGVGRPQ